MNVSNIRKSLIAVLFGNLLIICLYYFCYGSSFSSKLVTLSVSKDKPLVLFIAIGSGPDNTYRREEQRASWLKWLESTEGVTYKFFTDKVPYDRFKESDIIELHTLGGRTTNVGERAFLTLKYALNHYKFDYLLKIDDDSFLCLPTLLNELKSGKRPSERFIWGKYWRRRGKWANKIRMDENFLLFSRDVVSFVVSGVEHNILAFDGSVNFAVNLAFWTHFMNLTLFDDHSRIDAQQGKLTRYMHEPYNQSFTEFNTVEGSYDTFCNYYLYAHHVHPNVMQKVYETNRDYDFKTAKYIETTSKPNISYYLFETESKRFSGKLPHCVCDSLV